MKILDIIGFDRPRSFQDHYSLIIIRQCQEHKYGKLNIQYKKNISVERNMLWVLRNGGSSNAANSFRFFPPAQPPPLKYHKKLFVFCRAFVFLKILTLGIWELKGSRKLFTTNNKSDTGAIDIHLIFNYCLFSTGFLFRSVKLINERVFKRGKDATICIVCFTLILFGPKQPGTTDIAGTVGQPQRPESLNSRTAETTGKSEQSDSRNDRKVWAVGQSKRQESLNSQTAETAGKSEQSDSQNDRKVWTVGQPKRPESLNSRTDETTGKSEQSNSRNDRKVWAVGQPEISESLISRRAEMTRKSEQSDSRNDRKVWTVRQPKRPESLNSRTDETTRKSEQLDSRTTKKSEQSDSQNDRKVWAVGQPKWPESLNNKNERMNEWTYDRCTWRSVRGSFVMTVFK